MVRPNHPAEGPSRASWDRVDQLVEEFEAAWKSGTPPRIEDFLKRDDANTPTLLVELVHTDLERRLKKGEPVRVEAYLSRFPQIAEDRTRVVALIDAEFTFRQRGEPALSSREYEQRFPQYREDLTQRLRGPHRRKQHSSTVVTCPQCRQSFAASEDATENLSCLSCGHAFRLEQPPPLPPGDELRQLGSFELLGAVGQGAFGTVYRARDTALERTVAVKVPRSGQWATAAELERFEREARSAAQLVHPGIVPVYEVGREGSLPFIVSAFVRGRTLAEEIREKPPDARAAADLVAQVAEALHYAHQRGVVHRDLKPSNIMLGRIEESRRVAQDNAEENQGDDRRAFVMDFGLARRDEGESTVTVAGQILGTPAYMSPEQARGEGHEVDGRGDVYSAGVILYEMLTGELPFRGVARMVLQQILTEEPRPPHRLNDQVPRDLEIITLKCLTKERGKRYATAGDLATDLRRWLKGEPIHARPVGWWERSWRWARRNPRVAALSSMVAALLITIVLGSVVAAALFNAEKDKALHAQKDAERAQRDAETSQHKAEESATFAGEQLDLSLETLNKLVYEVQNKLADKPALHDLKMNLLDTAIAGLQHAAKNSEQRRTDLSMASAHARLGDIYDALGHSDKAREHYQKAMASSQAVLQQDATSSQAKETLATLYNRLGVLELKAGHSPVAHQLADRAMKATRDWLDREPNNAQAHLSRAKALNLFGDVNSTAGDVATATTAFADAVSEAQHALAKDTKNAAFLRELRYAYSNRGDMEMEKADFTAARRDFEKAVTLNEQELAVDSKSPRTRRTRAMLLERLADVHQRLNENSEAVAALKQCQQQRAELSAADPENLALRRDLEIACGKLARAAATMKDWSTASKAYDQCLQIAKALAEADPSNADAQRDLAFVSCLVGTACSLQSRNSEGRMHSARGVEIFRRLAEKDPGNIRARFDLAGHILFLADIELAARDFQTAAGHYGECVAMMRRLEKEGKLKGRDQFKPWLESATYKQEICKVAEAAVNDLHFALMQPDSIVGDLLIIRASVMASLGRDDQVVATAEALRRRDPEGPGNLFSVACCYAVSLRSIPSEKPSPEEAARRHRYAKAAIDTLRQMGKAAIEQLPRIETYSDLDPLRQEPEFQQFVQGLKANRNAQKKPGKLNP